MKNLYIQQKIFLLQKNILIPTKIELNILNLYREKEKEKEK